MKSIKKLLAFSNVFILGFSVATFGKITYKDITIELNSMLMGINGRNTKTLGHTPRSRLIHWNDEKFI